jgi:hypothetical protein
MYGSAVAMVASGPLLMPIGRQQLRARRDSEFVDRYKNPGSVKR